MFEMNFNVSFQMAMESWNVQAIVDNANMLFEQDVQNTNMMFAQAAADTCRFHQFNENAARIAQIHGEVSPDAPEDESFDEFMARIHAEIEATHQKMAAM